MNRKLICVLLVLLLCFSWTVSVSATSANDFIVDEVGVLTDTELAELNTYAQSIYDTCGVGIFFVYTTAEDLENYDIAPIVGGMDDYLIMMENNSHWIAFYGGKGMSIDLATEEQLRSVYDVEATYVDGVNAFLSAAATYFPGTEDAQVEVMEEVPIREEEFFVYDDADLLTDEEEEELAEDLIKYSKNHNAQLVVCTIASMDGGDIDAFDDYLYDIMDFGYGDNRDGVMLLVCMDPREYRIIGNGFAAKAINENVIESIGDEIVSDLSDGDYADALETFAQECDYYLDGYLNGFPFNAGKKLIISLVVGILAGVVVAFVLKGQLKTVRKQEQANVYVKPGSMQITYSNDLFLYRNVTRTKKESKNSSGSGSSRSSGGGSF